MANHSRMFIANHMRDGDSELRVIQAGWRGGTPDPGTATQNGPHDANTLPDGAVGGIEAQVDVRMAGMA